MRSATVLSILIFAAAALAVGAIVLWRRGGGRLQVILMLVLAMIMIANVMLWVVPDDHGTSLADAESGNP